MPTPVSSSLWLVEAISQMEPWEAVCLLELASVRIDVIRSGAL